MVFEVVSQSLQDSRAFDMQVETHVPGDALHDVCWDPKDSVQLHHLELRILFAYYQDSF